MKTLGKATLFIVLLIGSYVLISFIYGFALGLSGVTTVDTTDITIIMIGTIVATIITHRSIFKDRD